MTGSVKTLTVKVAGGLGNQLFMFYGGLHIARSLGKEVVFDITALKTIKNLHPGLNVSDLGLLENFQVIEETTKNSLGNTLGTLAERIVRKIGIGYLPGKFSNQFIPKEIGYVNPQLIGNKTSSVEGYFQSWRYFSSITARAELLASLEGKSSPWFEETLKDLQSEKPLVIHVRRGDFLRAENRSLGVLSKEYFAKIAELNPNRSIWIFSDSSPDSLVEFSKMQGVTRIVLPPDESDPIDSLLLMSKADVLGISNSTFSWWAGILSSPNSQVYAPKKWFERRSDPIDLIPLNWHRISSEWERQ
jgi:hypothetical protein